MSAPIHQPGERLIIYGTLKRKARGRPSWLNLSEAGIFLGSVRFLATMYNFGRYPGVTLNGDMLCHGELFRVDDPEIWPVLDAYEDVNWCCFERGEYRRVLTQVLDDFGEPKGKPAWIYEHNMADWREGYPVIGSGNWPTDDAATDMRRASDATGQRQQYANYRGE